MKKIIVLALVLSMLTLLIVPSFADSTEEEKILEAAKKGVLLYDLLNEDFHSYPALVYGIITNANPKLGDVDAEAYSYACELIPNIEGDAIEYDLLPEEIDPNNPFINPTEVYLKMGDSIKTPEDFKKLVSKYLLGCTALIDDENTVERTVEGYIVRQPLLRSINGSLYISSATAFCFGDPPFVFFDTSTVESNNGKTATVKVEAVKDVMENTYAVYTIDLKKVDGQWKVCGGTLFSSWFIEMDLHREFLFSPRTGEDFSLITHTLVIGVCAALMLVLSKRRKLEI